MYVGFDIGGTSVKYGVLDDNKNIVFKSQFHTIKNSDVLLLDKIAQAINDLAKEYSFTYVGIGAPGFVDSEKGIVAGSSNTPFKNTEVRAYLEEKTGKNILVGNDANCAAYAEYIVNKSNLKNFVMITLGTGVGGGIVIDNKLYTGTKGFAGEIGHIVTNFGGRKCPCGKKGCFEQYASATALIRMTKDKIRTGKGKLASEMKDRIDETSGRTVFIYEEMGCPDAMSVLDKYAKNLAVGLESVYSILQPDEIVLSGGITNEHDVLMKYLKKYLVSDLSVSASSMTNDAGLIGAALLGYKK